MGRDVANPRGAPDGASVLTSGPGKGFLLALSCRARDEAAAVAMCGQLGEYQPAPGMDPPLAIAQRRGRISIRVIVTRPATQAPQIAIWLKDHGAREISYMFFPTTWIADEAPEQQVE